MRRASLLIALTAMLFGTKGTADATGAPVPAVVAPERALEEIIEVERRFADESIERGLKKSFLDFAARDGIIFRRGPVPAVATLSADPDDDPRQAYLDWSPALAAISRSGDLGFSVGPWQWHDNAPPAGRPADHWGYYCTVWKRQGDGSWRFVVDGAGAEIGAKPTRVKGGPVERLPVPVSVAGVTEASAMREVAALEALIAKTAKRNLVEALSPHYSARAWVMGSDVEVVEGAAGWTDELKRRPAQVVFRTMDGGASSAGDMVYFYGSVEKAGKDEVLPGASFLHIWMREPGGWKMVFDGFKRGRRPA